MRVRADSATTQKNLLLFMQLVDSVVNFHNYCKLDGCALKKVFIAAPYRAITGRWGEGREGYE